MQLTHYNSKFKKKRFPITLISDGISNALNIGSLFRIADAFGVDKLILSGDDVTLGKRFAKTSRSAEKYIDYSIEPDIDKVLSHIATTHWIVGIEITQDSLPLTEIQINQSKPLAVIVGNENFGISESVLSKCDAVVHIDMFGVNSSMNVVQAAGIVLYEFTKRLQS